MLQARVVVRKELSMFSPPGYVALATLWQEFLEIRGVAVCLHAKDIYISEEFNADPFDLGKEFGSPLDFAETAFLKTIRLDLIHLISPDHQVTALQPSQPDGTSDIFHRASVFESTHIAERPGEAGKENEWLIRSGSRRFSPWPEKMGPRDLWVKRYVHSNQSNYQMGRLTRMHFHTLPCCFERMSFTIPRRLPPWCDDPWDELFVKTIVPQFLGHSICLTQTQAEKWRKSTLKGTRWRIHLGLDAAEYTNVGRPEIQEIAANAYWHLFPDGHSGTWKTAWTAVEEITGQTMSLRTLQRAVKKYK